MKKYTLIFMTLLFAACTNPNWDKNLLYGDWEVSEWVNTSTNQKINAKMDFTFNDDRTYVLDYGSEKESGTYIIMGDFLHTIETGQAEKKVKLVGLDADNLSFEMNRGGTIEVVKLRRK